MTTTSTDRAALRERVRDHYAAAARAVDEDSIRFWVALGTIRWGIITIAQAFTHLSGIVRSVELAEIHHQAHADGTTASERGQAAGCRPRPDEAGY